MPRCRQISFAEGSVHDEMVLVELGDVFFQRDRLWVEPWVFIDGRRWSLPFWNGGILDPDHCLKVPLRARSAPRWWHA